MDGSTRDRYGRMSMNGWYDRILLYDSGEHNDTALRLAIKVAADNGAVLTVAEVVPDGIRGFIGRMTALSEGRRDEIDRLGRKRRLDRWLASKVLSRITVVPAILEGTPSIEVVRAVLRHHFDLVIVTEGGHASLHGVFDGTVTRITRQCPCPVWVVKHAATVRRRRIAAAIGCGGPERALGTIDREIVTTAVNLARTEGARLDIVRPWDFRGHDLETGRSELTPAMYREFYGHHHHARADGVARLLRRLGIGGPGVVVHLPHGAPDSTLVGFVEANDIDLLVIGVDDEKYPPGLFANPIVESVMERVHCSVMVIKPADFVCPVPLAADGEVDGLADYPHLYGAEMNSDSPSKRVR